MDHDDQTLPPIPTEHEVYNDLKEYAGHTRFSFIGETWDLILLVLKNTLFTILTIGIYFPFAKTNVRRYFWNHIEFDGSSFEYIGTGKELLKGYIFALLYFGGFSFTIQFTQSISKELSFAVFAIYFICSIIVIPFAMYGSHAYKLSRTKLRGISFRVKKEGRKEFLITFIKYALITILTFGIGALWMIAALNRVKWKHTYYGNLQMSYHGEGFDIFIINLFNSFLALITLGIYTPWGIAKLTRYQANSLYLGEYNFDFKGSGFDVLVLYLKNILIIVCTLGLGTPWLVMLNLRFYANHFTYNNSLNYELVSRVESEVGDNSISDSMVDFLDIDFGF